MRLYAVYALPLKGKSQKKDELRKRLHTLHTTMRKVYSALLLPMFPTSGPNCIQTAYTVHTNCIQPTVCEETVNTDGGFVLRPVRNLMLAAGSEKRSDTTESIIRPNQTWPTCAVVRPDPDATGMQNRHAPRGSHVLNPSNSTGLRSPCHVACMQSARERCEKAQNPVGSKTQTGFRT